jgi:TolB protein
MDSDGSNLKQLTRDGKEFVPWLTPDGKTLVYSSNASGAMALWKVPLDGGSPIRLSDQVLTIGVLSPDGKWIASDIFDHGRWRVGVLSFETGALNKTFDLPFYPPTLWQPDGKALSYVDTHNGVSNLWAQPLVGGPPKQLTHFTDGIIFNYYWAPDGKRVALARGTITSDVVLINNLK